MFSLDEKDTAPVLQYSVEVTKRDPSSGWQTVPDFVSGSPRRPLSKEAFYSKLGQTPDASLPKVEQLVEITFRQEAKASQREMGEREMVVVAVRCSFLGEVVLFRLDVFGGFYCNVFYTVMFSILHFPPSFFLCLLIFFRGYISIHER